MFRYYQEQKKLRNSFGNGFEYDLINGFLINGFNETGKLNNEQTGIVGACGQT